MSRSPRPTSRAAAARTAPILALCLVVGLAVPSAAEPSIAPEARSEASDAWRARGLAYLDLPLRFRVRFDASYTRHAYASDDLVFAHLRAAGRGGPGRQLDRSLISRLALARPILERIELEIAFASHNRLATRGPMDLERHTIGALIRVTR